MLLFQRQVYLILQDPLRASRTCRSCPRINSKYSSIGAYIKHIFSVFSSGFSWVRHGFNDVISRASLELQSCFSLTSLLLQCHFVRSCCKLFFYGSGNSFYSTLQELSHSELLCCSGSSTAEHIPHRCRSDCLDCSSTVYTLNFNYFKWLCVTFQIFRLNFRRNFNFSLRWELALPVQSLRACCIIVMGGVYLLRSRFFVFPLATTCNGFFSIYSHFLKKVASTIFLTLQLIFVYL